jgi:predicted RNase H-like HicB family nuclease
VNEDSWRNTATQLCSNQCPEGGFNVLVPAIAEICTYGETLEEGREIAIRCYLESALTTGEPIPGDVAEITTERVAVTIPEAASGMPPRLPALKPEQVVAALYSPVSTSITSEEAMLACSILVGPTFA